MTPLRESPTPSVRQTHFGDPCIHCATPHDEVLPGPCQGDPAKAKVIGYASLGVRWDGVEHYRYRLSTNEVCEVHSHLSNHAPYYHFGRSDTLINPPPYDDRLHAVQEQASTSNRNDGASPNNTEQTP